VLELGPDAPNVDAQALSRALTGQGVSRQALNLAPRILALDAVLTAMPDHRVVEVHPELSFAELAGRVLDRKKSPEGVDQRLAVLAEWIPGVRGLVASRPRGVPVDDALDALAALWSAVRWRDGLARSLPPDAQGAPRIVI
jgi:predicted RNase H-like nuclease